MTNQALQLAWSSAGTRAFEPHGPPPPPVTQPGLRVGSRGSIPWGYRRLSSRGVLMHRLMPVPIVVITACAGPQETRPTIECTAEYVYAVRIQAVNGLSGEPIKGVSGWVQEADFVDSLEVPGTGGHAYAAGERPGTYSVSVRAPGYQPWDTAGVVVTADACHVHTEKLHAMLTPVRP